MGSFRVEFLGGPDRVPIGEQIGGLSYGVVHMVYGPASYALREVPEAGALLASNLTPAQQRASGALDLLDQIYQRKLRVRLLGHMDGGAGYHLYLKDKPALKPDGTLDLAGQVLRGGPGDRELVDRLGARFVQIEVPETTRALRNGAATGAVWPAVGLTDVDLQTQVKYRIDPGVWQTDLAVLVSVASWNTLPPPGRDLLARLALEHERTSAAAMRDRVAAEDKELLAAGMQVLTLEGPAATALRRAATDVAWTRMQARAGDQAKALRAKFVQE